MFVHRNFKPPLKESYFLFGPRGTGKTTWLKHAYSEALRIDLLNPREEISFSMHPELLIEKIDANPHQRKIIIDEVQKVPKILDVVHLLIEEKRDVQFILAGSSARKLRHGGANLLAGRALWKNFYPFMANELKDQFNLQKALKTGMIPLIWEAENPQEKLRSYTDLYVQEEVKAEALVRQAGNFSRFLGVMAYSHGSIVNFSNISRECAVPRKTVENYFQILQDLLLGYTINVFENRSKRAVSSHPKFYFFDPGVFRVLRKQGFLDLSTEVDGAALEGLIAEHLRNWINAQEEKNELYFWRTRAGLEVDFIVYGEKTFLALEIKNNHAISPHDLKGLKEFSKDYPGVTPVLLYRGKDKIKKDGILCFPVEIFFQELDPLKDIQQIWNF